MDEETWAQQIRDFVAESNRIERIFREPTADEIEVTRDFISRDVIRVTTLEQFVAAVAPGARLRTKAGMNVMVQGHVPPRGGLAVGHMLDDLVCRANEGADPYDIHIELEALHPFQDGNGRAGRALWAWQMCKQDIWPHLSRGFLIAFYYAMLNRSRRLK